MMQETQIPNKLRSVVIFLVLLTPAATNLVEHAGSVIILLLTLLGLYVFHQQGRLACRYVLLGQIVGHGEDAAEVVGRMAPLCG